MWPERPSCSRSRMAPRRRSSTRPLVPGSRLRRRSNRRGFTTVVRLGSEPDEIARASIILAAQLGPTVVVTTPIAGIRRPARPPRRSGVRRHDDGARAARGRGCDRHGRDPRRLGQCVPPCECSRCGGAVARRHRMGNRSSGVTERRPLRTVRAGAARGGSTVECPRRRRDAVGAGRNPRSYRPRRRMPDRRIPAVGSLATRTRGPRLSGNRSLGADRGAGRSNRCAGVLAVADDPDPCRRGRSGRRVPARSGARPAARRRRSDARVVRLARGDVGGHPVVDRVVRLVPVVVHAAGVRRRPRSHDGRAMECEPPCPRRRVFTPSPKREQRPTTPPDRCWHFRPQSSDACSPDVSTSLRSRCCGAPSAPPS